ncbi:hypothetical protein JD844_013962, partial [Phrynosoma platyrhinos]
MMPPTRTQLLLPLCSGPEPDQWTRTRSGPGLPKAVKYVDSEDLDFVGASKVLDKPLKANGQGTLKTFENKRDVSGTSKVLDKPLRANENKRNASVNIITIITIIIILAVSAGTSKVLDKPLRANENKRNASDNKVQKGEGPESRAPKRQKHQPLLEKSEESAMKYMRLSELSVHLQRTVQKAVIHLETLNRLASSSQCITADLDALEKAIKNP